MREIIIVCRSLVQVRAAGEKFPVTPTFNANDWWEFSNYSNAIGLRLVNGIIQYHGSLEFYQTSPDSEWRNATYIEMSNLKSPHKIIRRT